MIRLHGIGWKDARAAVKKYDPVDVGQQSGRVEIF
jgi:hypothetical protein